MPRDVKRNFLLQSLKESMLSEQQTLSQQLQQEKLSLASEKSRLEMLARLHGTPSPDILKVVEFHIFCYILNLFIDYIVLLLSCKYLFSSSL